MQDIAFWSAKRLAAHIRRRRIGCLELLEHYLERVDRFNPQLNAIVVTDLPAARQRAKAADEALANGDVWGPLHGVPMTVKESYDVAGLPTTWGDPALKASVATTNAIAVDRLIDAGAVVFGKTNVPLMLADWQSFNDIYGTTNNPWDLTRAPGGSSGGSAAAMAAGLSGLEIGSDIGSSIRNPAHYCGVYGHKPTWGLCPPRGHALAGRVSQTDISVIGPLARSADDLAIALAAMAGPEPIEAAGYRLVLPKPKTELRQFRVAVLTTDPVADVDESIQQPLRDLTAFLRARKVKVSETARPALDSAATQRVYLALLMAAMSGRQSDETFARNQAAARASAADDHSIGTAFARANVMPHKDWLGLNEERHRMRLAWAAFFEDYDVLLCPPCSSPAFPHNHEGEMQDRAVIANGKPVTFGAQLFWAGYSGVAYLPSTVAPLALTDEGLPVGVQIIGPQYGDRNCIAFARLLEKQYRGFTPPPGYA